MFLKQTEFSCNNKSIMLSELTALQRVEYFDHLVRQSTDVAGVCLLASATGIKLVSGKSAIEMTASGAVNITCENFNISAKNDGQINTGHVLDLNMEGGGLAENEIKPDTGKISSKKSAFFRENKE